MPTRVVHCKCESYDTYIGRPSKWGNPYSIGIDGYRGKVIEKYKKNLVLHSELIIAAREELKGKTLGCWCSPALCHGDILAYVAEGNDL